MQFLLVRLQVKDFTSEFSVSFPWRTLDCCECIRSAFVHCLFVSASSFVHCLFVSASSFVHCLFVSASSFVQSICSRSPLWSLLDQLRFRAATPILNHQPSRGLYISGYLCLPVSVCM